MRKMKAWTQKGVVIHDPVKAAQKGWSSFHKSKKVAKSVATSVRPMMTLKKKTLQSGNILQVLQYQRQNISIGSFSFPLHLLNYPPGFKH